MRQPRALRRGQTAVYHCISRTVNGQFLFGDREKEAFRQRFRKLARFCQIEILDYAVLSNHFHLLGRVPAQVQLSDAQLLKALCRFYGKDHPKSKALAKALQEPDSAGCAQLRASYLARMGDLSVFMKELKEGFTKWFNALHERFGPLWAERFRSLLKADNPYVLTLVAAYIDLNGFRSGNVADPAHYRFCGYGEALAGGKLARAGLESFLEGNSWEEKLAGYRQVLFGKGAWAKDDRQRRLEPERVWEVYQAGGRLSVAEALRLKVRYMTEGWALGTEEFVQEVFEECHRGHYRRERRQVAWPMEGADWGELRTLRKLKDPLALPKRSSGVGGGGGGGSV